MSREECLASIFMHMSDNRHYKALKAEFSNKHLMGDDNPNPKNLGEGLKLLDNYSHNTLVSRRPIHDQYKTVVYFVQRGGKHKDEQSIFKKKEISKGKSHCLNCRNETPPYHWAKDFLHLTT